jgi:uncharacterized membrane protein YbaN (DUF454 family)
MATETSRTTPPADDRRVEPAQVVSSRIGRAVYAALGFLSLGLGIAGYIVPLLPGTVFLLLATFFFFKSNERMYNWVLNDPRFGPLIRNYRAGYGIPRRIKVLAIVMVVISFAVSVLFVADGVVTRSVLIACAAGVSAFILTRPTTEIVLDRI